MPKLITAAEREQRRRDKQAAKEAKLLPPDELKERRRAIYGNTKAARRIIKGLKTQRTAKTLAEGRKPKTPKASKKGTKQICVLLDIDVEAWALTHSPMAKYINDLIRADMMANKQD